MVHRPAVLLVALGLLIAPVLPAQEEDNRTERRVARYVERMDAAGGDLWEEALKLEALGPEAVDSIKAAMKGKGEKARLGSAKALCRLGSVETGLASMMDIVRNGTDLQVRIWAADLLGIEGDTGIEDDLEKLLDATFDPKIKIALSKALWNSSRNVRGTRELKALLESEDVELRYEAALALGEVGDIDAAKIILNDLKREPTPRGRLARSLLEQQRITQRYEKLLFSGVNKGESGGKEPSFLKELVELVKEFHVLGEQPTEEELLVAAARGMVAAMDEHSSYWTKKEWTDFLERLRQDYAGIGVYVGMRDGYFTILSPIYSGPAYKMGLRTGDRILEVDGWSAVGEPMEEIIRRVKGMAGTFVNLKIFRSGWSQPREFKVERRQIEVPSVFYKMLPGNVGYVEMIQFGKETPKELGAALDDLEGKGMEGLILDVRDNGGGYLDSAVAIADFFLDGDKLIVYSEGRNKQIAPRTELRSSEKGTHPNYPMVMLINGGSASASEILAGALSEYKRAVVVGERTYGKGTVQQVLDLKSRPEDKVRLTIARYYLPSGKSVDRVLDKEGHLVSEGGVEPDIKVGPAANDSWKNEALQQLLEKEAFKNYIDANYEANKELMHQLAEDDGRDVSKYPNFDAWFQGLGTRASRDDVRTWLRDRVRNRVADDVGHKMIGDFVEDLQLQKAIVTVMEKTKTPAGSIDSYKSFAGR